MELTNEFRVAVPVATAWEVLTDVERIAPCMPGAQLEEIEGDEYRGVIKVKVGPITAQYRGAARFVERDEGGHRAVLRAEGRETRGQGNANAVITATLAPDGGGTVVTVVTDLTVTGKVAQFGRGVLADVSSRLLDQFASCLASSVLTGPGTGAPAVTAEGSDPGPTGDGSGPVAEAATGPAPEAARTQPAVRRVDGPPATPVDLLATAGRPVAKRVGPIVAVVALGWLLRVLLKRRRK